MSKERLKAVAAPKRILMPSRIRQVDLEKCTRNADGCLFDMILAAGMRARTLSNQGQIMTGVSALLDIQNQTIDYKEYLAEAGKPQKPSKKTIKAKIKYRG